MDTEIFFQKIRSYINLSMEAEKEWSALLKEKTYDKMGNCLYGCFTITGPGILNSNNQPRIFFSKGMECTPFFSTISSFYLTD